MTPDQLHARHTQLVTERERAQRQAHDDDLTFAGALAELSATIKHLQERHTLLSQRRTERQQQGAADDASYAGALGELERTIGQFIGADDTPEAYRD